ncbi:MAG: TetR/AcrR family transcriptional regulator [Oscillospiraceae bacterium]|nr:TetR/AcrR family transcriptional regulator [Oscillospiraceae bacterium]MDD7280076.1 TetR/AcrR family transcriptional regulator [Oscillospiraceae bacterium]MDY2864501.1 TetR/AcrR family transcriptional regulator [Oscillospiraceae bacterium]
MPNAFTEEESKRIRQELILAGIRLSKELGVQKMSVEKLTAAVGIAKGSFYLFFGSKEDFILEVAAYASEETQKMLLKKLNGRTQMSAHEFMEFFNEYLHSDLDLMNGLTVSDFYWLKNHIKKQVLFDPDMQIKTALFWLSLISDVREGVDTGTFVNLIKSIYAIREHSDTMVIASLENSVRILLHTIEIYISGKGEII